MCRPGGMKKALNRPVSNLSTGVYPTGNAASSNDGHCETQQLQLHTHRQTSSCHAGHHCTIEHKELECGPMPNVMVALPNIGGALCSTPQSLADAHY